MRRIVPVKLTIRRPHSPFYSGQYLADNEDVVVVTVNYRLGIFGFSGAPGIEQNTGLRDQRSAVEWVKDNILGFGGDPDRIIIFGQSAGGAAVDYWAYAYQHDPIVAGMISHSGTALSYTPNTPEYSQSIYHNVSTTLGCTKDQNTLSCLRRKNVTDILSAARDVPALPTQALAQATFHPTADNITVFADYAALGAAGSFAKIPYLAGAGDYEAGFYRVSAFGANVSLSPERWELFNERAFTCPTKYANGFRVTHGVPTWRYRYMGDFDNTRLYDSWGDYPNSGSYHGSDLTALLGTAEDVTGESNSEEQQRFSRYMQGAWAAFGRDPVRGLELYGWPSYPSNTSSLILLSNGNQAEPEFVTSGLYGESCPPVSENDPRPGRGAF
jgi:carboxylesterase type B